MPESYTVEYYPSSSPGTYHVVQFILLDSSRWFVTGSGNTKAEALSHAKELLQQIVNAGVAAINDPVEL